MKIDRLVGPTLAPQPRRARVGFAAIVFAVAMSSLAWAEGDELPGHLWIGTWRADPVFPQSPPSFPAFSNQTIRETARISIGGDRLRVRLTNETSTQEVMIGAAHIAIAGTNGATDPASDRVLTFGGEPSILLRAGAAALSDPVDLAIGERTTLAVSIFLPNATSPIVGHRIASSTTFISKAGNFTGAADFPTASTATSSFLLSGIDVSTATALGAIVTLGDSITDGFRSTVDANHRWPDFLFDRFADRHQLLRALVNAGISGNRVLQDQPLSQFGPNALSRFDRDVLATPGVREVILLEGVNDIGIGDGVILNQAVTADDIIAGYKELIARAHENGVRIFGGTLTPFINTQDYNVAATITAASEAKRQAFNQFIRTSGAFDGIVDFDAAIRDPSDPARMLPSFDSGDHLHPNDSGYRAMANAVDLRLFEADLVEIRPLGSR